MASTIGVITATTRPIASNQCDDRHDAHDQHNHGEPGNPGANPLALNRGDRNSDGIDNQEHAQDQERSERERPVARQSCQEGCRPGQRPRIGLKQNQQRRRG
jgi:hypothetical protein